MCLGVYSTIWAIVNFVTIRGIMKNYDIGLWQKVANDMACCHNDFFFHAARCQCAANRKDLNP